MLRRHLALDHNNIGDNGVRALGTAACEGALPACRVISLNGNPLLSEEAQEKLRGRGVRT